MITATWITVLRLCLYKQSCKVLGFLVELKHLLCELMLHIYVTRRKKEGTTYSQQLYFECAHSHKYKKDQVETPDS